MKKVALALLVGGSLTAPPALADPIPKPIAEMIKCLGNAGMRFAIYDKDRDFTIDVNGLGPSNTFIDLNRSQGTIKADLSGTTDAVGVITWQEGNNLVFSLPSGQTTCIPGGNS